ncbi:MAG: ATP synthase F1 subunit gamma [Candidatus Delongbacteria bacterium]|nr:ATP synthase F1 subunit gamma [Candidatus Delongbacteria bacterium]MBN2836601.1 ATP synthase F1 subunit gamma [Candidatus Delongbacteria bacterium]
MATLKELKIRRKSVTSTKKVTSSMKMIAASRLRKSQDNMMKARPYSNKLREVVSSLLSSDIQSEHLFLKKFDSDKKLYVVITSDRGLCGGFNSNIIKEFKRNYRIGTDDVIAVGNKIIQRLTKDNFEIKNSYKDAFQRFDFGLAKSIGSDLKYYYSTGQYSSVILIYNSFVNAVSQSVTSDEILPAVISVGSKISTEFIVEPEVEVILEDLFPRYINTLIWRALLESYASENAARMNAMDSATDNAEQMIASLTLQINKARQAAITNEIAEIVGGSSAIQN